ncbi:MAG: hypothetical protein QOG28_1842 [Trebonia sp.]|jgi:hypothetical protein|nr:hypothetical protein [Trebonia sp.]
MIMGRAAAGPGQSGRNGHAQARSVGGAGIDCRDAPHMLRLEGRRDEYADWRCRHTRCSLPTASSTATTLSSASYHSLSFLA